eukprot:Blabericola_migrator_1__12365@NODE_775_length_6567_cov_33_564000_g551_i0_p1_GENE_NODE_775_length_6567_cov_33_564000_g551_i0NODE_775_length_6567_cov_33_564000_g551_i0_p1_ORF_typecomplete_len515_score92_64TipAS/PF07739_13/1_8e04TipAS/PF07739_13/1_9e02TipAS/PF07739_13/6_NODE_775_length_6567_cov_33_564000_g551_i024433987
MSRHLIKEPRPLNLKSIRDLAVLLSVACPFTEQDLQYLSEWFHNPPDTEFEYSIAVREYLRAALLCCVTPKGFRPIEGVTPDIKIEPWADFLMYNVKRVSSTELSLEDSWQAFVQSLNEHLGIETDKGFVYKQLPGHPFRVYARKRSSSTLQVGVPSSHKIEEFRKLLETETSSACLDSAKAFRAAFWNEYHHPYDTLAHIRDCALRAIREACHFGHENDLQSDEWESPLSCTKVLSHACSEQLRVAQRRLAEARDVEAREMERAERRQENKIRKLTRVGFGTKIQSIDDRSYDKPPEIYLSNLKRWERGLTRLLNLERVQNEHCWQVALDFVRQQMAVYSKWTKDHGCESRTLADTMNLMCETSDVTETQVQEFQERLKAETEMHPRFQRLADILLEWSQHCLDHIEKEKEKFNKDVNNRVKNGASYAQSALERFADAVSYLETEDWDEDTFEEAIKYSRRFVRSSTWFKEALDYKGMDVEPWLELEREWAQLNTRLERAHEQEVFLTRRRAG